jgi:hypothetical protein
MESISRRNMLAASCRGSLDGQRSRGTPELLQAHLTLDRQVVDALRMNKTQAVPAPFETGTGKPGSPHLTPAAGDTEKII